MIAATKPKPEAPTVEPLLSMNDVAGALRCSRRTLESMRAGGRFAPADCFIGRSPSWKPETIRDWIGKGGSR